MLDKIDELFESVHNQSGQQLKVDKILNVLSEGDEIESNADLEFEHFFDGDFGQANRQPSHDEPAVRGLR